MVKSVEAEAIELFTQKKQLQNQRDELRKLISAMCGPNAWQELSENGSGDKKAEERNFICTTRS